MPQHNTVLAALNLPYSSVGTKPLLVSFCTEPNILTVLLEYLSRHYMLRIADYFMSCGCSHRVPQPFVHCLKICSLLYTSQKFNLLGQQFAHCFYPPLSGG